MATRPNPKPDTPLIEADKALRAHDSPRAHTLFLEVIRRRPREAA